MSINLTATATCPDCKGVVAGDPGFVERVIREHRAAHAATRGDIDAQLELIRQRFALLEEAVFNAEPTDPDDEADEPVVDDGDESDEP